MGPKVPSNIPPPHQTANRENTVFRGVDIDKKVWQKEVQPHFKKSYDIVYGSHIEDDKDMSLDEALGLFKLKYTVVSYIYLVKNTTAVDGIKYIAENRSPVVCQLNARIMQLKETHYPKEKLSELMKKFVEDADLIPIWARTDSGFQFFAMNVVHPSCRRRFMVN